MTTIGWIFMALSLSTVWGGAFWCFRKVLQTPVGAIAPHRPAAHGATRDAVRRAIAPRQSGLPETAREEGLLSESLEERLLALQGGGVPLPGEVRADMEARFGLDFGAVRIHTDAEAAQLADAVGAHAFALQGAEAVVAPVLFEGGGKGWGHAESGDLVSWCLRSRDLVIWRSVETMKGRG